MRCEAIWEGRWPGSKGARARGGERCPFDDATVKLHDRTNRWLCWVHSKAVDNCDRKVPVQFVASRGDVPRRVVK